MRRFLAVIFCLLGLSAVASAQSVDDLLAKFESTKFDDIEAAINGLAASGSPQAPAILEALTSGNLVFQPAQNKAYIKTARRRAAGRRDGCRGAGRCRRVRHQAGARQQPHPPRGRGGGRRADPDEPGSGQAPGGRPGGPPLARGHRPAGPGAGVGAGAGPDPQAGPGAGAGGDPDRPAWYGRSRPGRGCSTAGGARRSGGAGDPGLAAVDGAGDRAPPRPRIP